MQARAYRLTTADTEWNWHILHMSPAPAGRVFLQESDDDHGSGRFATELITGGCLSATGGVFLQTDPDAGETREIEVTFEIITTANPLELLNG